MTTYITKQGDTFDSIAYSQLGDTRHTDALIDVNHDYIDVFQFSSGIEIAIPDIAEGTTYADLPPWKRVSG